MEVTLPRRKLQKHLEPARPLRRFNVDEVSCIAILFRIRLLMCINLFFFKNNITVEQFYNIIHLHQPKQGRISYTRDVLCELAFSPVAKKKPEYLPEHPIVLEKAREPHLMLHEMRKESHGKHASLDEKKSTVTVPFY
ncbi:unnamed protein product [Lota lota]